MRPNCRARLQEWTVQGFDVDWLVNLRSEPSSSDTCGLTGSRAMAVMKSLESLGGIRRGKIQTNHKRIWLAGGQHDRWVKASRELLAEA